MVNQTPDAGRQAMANEPIAVIGMGCRFAGDVDSPERFWNFLMDGEDAIGEIPSERWEPYASSSAENAALLRRTTRFGGAFLADVDGFDAEFFGISPTRGRADGPAAADRRSKSPGRPSSTPASRRAAWRAATPASSSASARDDYGRRLLEDLPRIEAWTGIGGVALRGRQPRSRTPWTCAGRAWRWTPPARRRWSRSTWRARACACGEMPGGARRRRHAHGGARPDDGAGRRRRDLAGRPVEVLRRGGRRLRPRRGRGRAGAQAARPTRSATATASSP